jgi:hypothetical protein
LNTKKLRVYTTIFKKTSLAHNLQLILGGPAHLRKAQTPFDTLQVFPRSFIAEDMGLLIALV